MSWESKVLWLEGLFLQPHHFQQADRHLESLVSGMISRIGSCLWGVTQLEIDEAVLKVGQFALRSCSGLMPDGTLFRIPASEDHPPSLEVPSTIRNCSIYLTLPMSRQGSLEVDMSGIELSTTRLRPAQIEVTDTIDPGKKPVTMAIGKLRLQFALEVDEMTDRLFIPIARIVEVRADREVILDRSFMASCLDVRAAPSLHSFMRELIGLLENRMLALSARISEGKGGRNTAEIADFMLLMLVNRVIPVFKHLETIQNLHPSLLFRECVSLAGEMATFVTAEKKLPELPVYTHGNLTACFMPVITLLRTYLSSVLEQSAVLIALESRNYGISVGIISDRSLLSTSSFVLAVSADIAAEHIRRHFAGQAKIGPVEEIRQLVNSALPGIPMQPLPVVPRQIPYHSGFVYFNLDSQSPYWGKMMTSGGIAVHVSGEYPGLKMELWAIRNS